MYTKQRLPLLWVTLLITLLVGCKKTVDPAVVTPSLSLVGNWKITAVTFTPGWVQYTNATPITDYVAHLKGKGETCLTDITVSFTSAGVYSTNAGSTASCSYAADSQIILNYLFSEGSTFSETDTQATLYSKNKASSIPVTKSGTSQLLTIQFQSDEDLSSNKIKTTYSVTMVRQ
ncbi:hypothetical protein [Fibrella forsythiae]|uniref:Lipocalin-like domain-containing protein n=1 Tax=Fibrella forsythiae TaxID=2817061 RepID=A0ABS3JHC5_9BACT|nr:hypothetical protein [Fibrella forsythiae]MBO0948644.1 hypothetical protein [Fibrella forsythiae]